MEDIRRIGDSGYLFRTIEVLKQLRRGILPRIQAQSYSIQEKKTDDFVTSIDLEIAHFLRKQLPQEKNWRWLSEETVTDENYDFEAPTWIIDPIDGTRELIAGIPEFVISVALAMKKKIALGVILNPLTGDCFYGFRGGGCYLNGKRTRVLEPSNDLSTIWAVSRTDLKRRIIPPDFMNTNLRPLGSIAYKLALVAAGKIHGTFSVTPKNIWDYAAGALIVHEAEGRVVNRHGKDLTSVLSQNPIDGLVACGSTLSKNMAGLLKEVFAG